MADIDTVADGEWPVDPAYAPPSPPPPVERVREERGVFAIERGRRFGPAAVLAGIAFLLVLVLAGALVWVTARRDSGATGRTTTTPQGGTATVASDTAAGPVVPGFVGQTLTTARHRLAARGIQVDVRRTESSRPTGVVLAQSPRAGARLGAGARVVLVVAAPRRATTPPSTSTATGVAVPRVTGLTERAATAALERAGMQVVSAKRASTQAAGTIIAQDPAGGAHAERGSTIRLQVAIPSGPPKVLMPRLVGLARADAESRLRSRGLRATVVTEVSSRVAGTVLGQSPVAGAQLRRGMSVELRVSSAPAKIEVPDVTGLDAAGARQQLGDAGFVVDVAEEPVTDPSQDGVVVDERPAGGISAARGSTVTITVGRAAADPAADTG